MILPLLAIHWVADFLCQTRWMGNNKSRDFDALILHVVVYTIVLGAGLAALAPFMLAVTLADLFRFIAINAGLHLVTDFLTSRATSWLWRGKREWAFWAMIGFDQLLHQAALIATAIWLLRV